MSPVCLVTHVPGLHRSAPVCNAPVRRVASARRKREVSFAKRRKVLSSPTLAFLAPLAVTLEHGVPVRAGNTRCPCERGTHGARVSGARGARASEEHAAQSDLGGSDQRSRFCG